MRSKVADQEGSIYSRPLAASGLL